MLKGIKERKIDPLKEESLYWLESDSGAWEGPLKDWENSHSKLYFEKLKKCGTVVTAGGNCGMYTYFYSKLFERVFTFEPDMKNFQCLVLNNPFDHVFPFRAALGKEPGFALLNNPSTQNTGTHSIDWESKETNVPVMTIDNLNLDDCDLIQIDVEGSEPEVIFGALKTIEKFKPVVVTERNYREIEDELKKYGYQEICRSAADTIYAVV